MKILWLGGVILPCIATAEKLNPVYVNGWLIKTSDMIAAMPENRFIYVFENTTSIQGAVNNIHYYGVRSDGHTSDRNYNALISQFHEILTNEEPDIIHIWGTESARSLAFVEACKAAGKLDNTVVSIQGVVSKCAIHYTAYLSNNVVHSYTLRDFLKGNIYHEQKRFIKSGQAENLVLSQVKHVIGRTEWDRACVWDINPNINYHFNNETLREEFYGSQWEYDKCEKYSIFCSQGNYPLKGAHLVIKALARVKREFPEAHLYIAGKDIIEVPWYKLSSYGKYLKRLIKQYGLEENVTFVGYLDANSMKERFLKSNVFVSPSVIENSPNSLGEAMILGVPCVSSRVGGVHNLLEHNKEGYLYPADEYYMLSYYLCDLFRNPDKATMFGVNAKKHALYTHDPQKNYLSLLEIYSSITK